MENEATKMIKIIMNEMTFFSCSSTNKRSAFLSIQVCTKIEGFSSSVHCFKVSFALSSERISSLTKSRFNPEMSDPSSSKVCVASIEAITRFLSALGLPVLNNPATVNSVGKTHSESPRYSSNLGE